jgi:hypothetical protein
MFDRYKKSSIEIKVFFIVIIRMIVNNIRNVSCLWSKQFVKERIEGGANEKVALTLPVTTLSFASISIFPG